MKIGYARVSTQDQNLTLQTMALRNEGCERIFEEKISGAKSDRPVFAEMLSQFRPGDVLVVWKLDRLGRSLKNLIDIVKELTDKNVGLKSLNDPIDTTSTQGRFVFNLFASLAEYERELIRERTNAGLAAARARGRLGGRRKGLSEESESISYVVAALYKEQKLTVREIAKKLGISVVTLYKYLKIRGVEVGPYVKGGALQR